MVDDTGKKFFRYTNRQRRHETKTYFYQKKIKLHRKRAGILVDEMCLSKLSSKTCDFNAFKKYVALKNIIETKYRKQNRDPIFRKYKWYSYINKCKSEDKLLNSIEEKYKEEGKKLIFIMGNWSVVKTNEEFFTNP